MKIILFLTALIAIFNLFESAYCNGKPHPGTFSNEYGLLDQNLQFIRSVKNAKLYMAGPPNARFPVAHVWGTPYEMGYAQGQIVKGSLTAFVTKTYSYLTNMIVEGMGPVLPPEVQAKVVLWGMNKALDWTANVTAPYTPQYFYDELHGIADATGIDFQVLLRLNLFAELTKASCSFFGAWGSATKNGEVLQLRSLDYDIDGPFKDYPQITVYHPDVGNAFANMGWPGSIGVLTGYSSQKLAISEIGVTYPDESFGQGLVPTTPPEKVHGEPWMLVTRDVLQFKNSLEEGIKSIQDADRTCNLIIGLGDGKAGKVNGIQYSGYVANPYDDQTLLPEAEDWHPKIEDVVYNGMDWLCPSYTATLGNQLASHHGSIDANVVVHDVLPTTQTGNLHISIFDLTNDKMHVSFCRSSTADASEPFFAYDRGFTTLEMKGIFAEQRP